MTHVSKWVMVFPCMSTRSVKSVDRVGIYETVTRPPGSLDTEGRRSVSHSDEYTETHLSDTSAMTSKADSTPSSLISTPEVSAALYTSQSGGLGPYHVTPFPFPFHFSYFPYHFSLLHLSISTLVSPTCLRLTMWTTTRRTPHLRTRTSCALIF